MLPDPDDLLALEPEELAGVLIMHLNSLQPNEHGSINPHNFLNPVYPPISSYPYGYRSRVAKALMEAWGWLVREGLIAPQPQEEGWYFITRRGRQITEAVDLQAYRRADMLPKRLLHPVIAQKVWATFLRGDYDIAVFQSFKEVEVRVRAAGGFDAQDLGTDLVRKAFHITSGPLTDMNVVKSERQALSDLFAGAIGLYKNSHSHRNVQIDSTEAVEMIMLASHLLKIVDSRSATP
jgi:uncharacterized protein (TIGR02391 family)